MKRIFIQADFKPGMAFIYKGKKYVVTYVGVFNVERPFDPFSGEYGIKATRTCDFKKKVFIIADHAMEIIDIL